MSMALLVPGGCSRILDTVLPSIYFGVWRTTDGPWDAGVVFMVKVARTGWRDLPDEAAVGLSKLLDAPVVPLTLLALLVVAGTG